MARPQPPQTQAPTPTPQESDGTVPVRVERVLPVGLPRRNTEKSGGRLLHGENLSVLNELCREGLEGKVDLIYVDPPFFAGQDFHFTEPGDRETPLPSGDREPVYVDRWPGGLSEYLDMLTPRLDALLRLLSPVGSLWVHLDWHAVHHVKVLLDRRLGADAFRNEIVWCYNGPGSPRMRQFNRKHDTLLWYTKGKTWTFNDDAIREPHHPKTRSNFKGSLMGSGFGPEQRLLPEGKVPEDWWPFAVAARYPVDGIRRTGYPTEKPVALLERLLLATSNPGDLVLDAFSGSGTLAYTAELHDRRWIGIEASPLGIHLTRKRLIASAKTPFHVERREIGQEPLAHPIACDISECGAFPDGCDAVSLGILNQEDTFVSNTHLVRMGRSGDLLPVDLPVERQSGKTFHRIAFDDRGLQCPAW